MTGRDKPIGAHRREHEPSTFGVIEPNGLGLVESGIRTVRECEWRVTVSEKELVQRLPSPAACPRVSTATICAQSSVSLDELAARRSADRGS